MGGGGVAKLGRGGLDGWVGRKNNDDRRRRSEKNGLK